MKKLPQRLINFSALVAVTGFMALAFAQLLPAQPVYAQNSEPPCSNGYVEENGRCVAKARNTCNTVPLNVDTCPFLKNYVVPAINVLAASVGIVVLIMVAWGGLQYTSSRDNPQQTAAAKDHIRNAILALVIYIFMIAFLNWVVPGGVFI